jgi:hypothetical protein
MNKSNKMSALIIAAAILGASGPTLALAARHLYMQPVNDPSMGSGFYQFTSKAADCMDRFRSFPHHCNSYYQFTMGECMSR